MCASSQLGLLVIGGQLCAAPSYLAPKEVSTLCLCSLLSVCLLLLSYNLNAIISVTFERRISKILSCYKLVRALC